MSAVDGGDGSVLQGDEQPAGDSASVVAESNDHSQDLPGSAKEQGEECRGRRRGGSNSTSGRWDSTTSWGEHSYRRGDDRHWKQQWQDDSWSDDRNWWWQSDDQWKDAWDDEDDYCDDDEDDDNQSWDPWASAWNKKQKGDGYCYWQSGGWRERRQGDDRRRDLRPPQADGGAVRVQGNDYPGHRDDSRNIWDGWRHAIRHFSGSDKSDSGSTGGGDRRCPGGGSRPSEKLTVPGFSGEDADDVGTSEAPWAKHPRLQQRVRQTSRQTTRGRAQPPGRLCRLAVCGAPTARRGGVEPPWLQQAAVIHDRGHRKPWEGNSSGKGKRLHTAHFTEADDSLDSGDDDHDYDDEDGGVSEEVAIAYATYQTAKQKYKENQKNRRFTGGQGERHETQQGTKNNEKSNEKIRMMKAKSFCSGCGRRGHWHKDPECPHNQGQYQKGVERSKPSDVGFCNLLPAEVFAIKHENAGLVGITDTACARTVAGSQWLQTYLDKLAAIGAKPELRKECEAYRFGTGKIYYSSFFVVLAFELGDKVVHVRTSIINGDVPLLLSKTVLGKLGMVFDIERGQADFNKVGLRGFDLLVTASGHPAIPIVPTRMDGDPSAFHAEDLKLVPKGEYMVFAVAHGAGPSKNPERYNFFYDKKLDPGVKDMLTRERLPQDQFLAWWRASAVMSDFWLECEHAWVRIHVTPRKALFNPSTWKTRATVQKEMLAQTAVEVRVTDGVCCTSSRWLETVVDRWQHGQINEPLYDFLWVGRT